jgi:vacuolar-type H+-ATPase subunit H
MRLSLQKQPCTSIVLLLAVALTILSTHLAKVQAWGIGDNNNNLNANAGTAFAKAKAKAQAKAQAAVEDAKKAAKDAAQVAKQAAKDAAQEAKRAAIDIGQDAKQAATDAAKDATSSAVSEIQTMQQKVVIRQVNGKTVLAIEEVPVSPLLTNTSKSSSVIVQKLVLLLGIVLAVLGAFGMGSLFLG